MTTRLKSTKGSVTLIVLLLVLVALIAVAVLMPSGGPTRQDRNESIAVSTLRTINTVEITYRESSGKGKYGTLSELVDAGLIHPDVKAGKSGYDYNVTVTLDGKQYTATAWPNTNSYGGKYGFYSTAEAVVYYSSERRAACDPCFPRGKAGQPIP